ncbi:hypothetical protein SASPL_108808 [Salvia splendens]|uniref:Hepatocyte growth factor-regulated tyrosine kinase substrate n=1 Tax=Salvia splendens TaxID=180675 RepID=A0A8X8YF49_SALSN|nr:hypothetical protein SASPL_108808 [Salvia splendens]
MISSIASSSSVTVRVEKATSEFLIGPDWTLNMEICDILNSNQMLAKDVVKAVKKRLQHKKPKVQLLALTLLETLVKNCGDYVHFHIAEKNILPEMVKITDMHVRDKILTLIGSWHEAFGGLGRRHPQYYMAYEDLRRFGVQFPHRPPDAAPIHTPATHAVLTPPGYGMSSSSSTRINEATGAEDTTLSLSGLNSMCDVLELLTDMLRAVDPSDRSAVNDEIIVDLVEKCRINQRKLVELLGTTRDEEILGKGLELNDSLQSVLAKHDAIVSGSPLPPAPTPTTRAASESQQPDHRSSEVSTPPASSNETPPAPAFTVIDEKDVDEEDDFAQLARRHSKARSNVSQNSSKAKSDVLSQEATSSPAMSNALVPIGAPASVETKDQNIIELLSIVLSTGSSSNEQSSSPDYMPSSTSPGTTTVSPEAYPASNNYVAPWAQPQPQQTPQQPRLQPYQQPPYNSQSPVYNTQPQQQSQYQQQYQYNTSQPQPQPQPQPHNSQYAYTPPPWATTPGYFSSHNPMYTYLTPRPMAPFSNGEAQAASCTRPKPFIPSYRLFEDLDVFSSGDGRFRTTSNATPSLSGPTSQNMVGGRM